MKTKRFIAFAVSLAFAALMLSACTNSPEVDTAPENDPLLIMDEILEYAYLTTIPAYVTISDYQFSTELTELNLTSMGLTDEDIEPLQYLINLTVLLLSVNEISDLTPLAGLTNLTHLDLNFNEIYDLTPLSGLYNLETLHLMRNEISDITPLAGLTNLVFLRLGGNVITDVTPLGGLTNLELLDLRHNEITDVTPLDELINSERVFLALDNNPISDFTAD